jgi:hypothetical protein
MVKRKTQSSKSKAARVKALPWAALLRVGFAAGRRWRSLSERDRARLTELVRESRGRLGNLSSGERRELRKLAGKLDLRGIGEELRGLLRGKRGGKCRKRKRR